MSDAEFEQAIPVPTVAEKKNSDLTRRVPFEVEGSAVACWWVNNKQTFQHEVGGDYIWSPLTRRDGGRSVFYDNMQRVRPGDIVFAYANGQVRAVGKCVAPAIRAPKPAEFGAAGDAWQDEGWLVRVDFTRLSGPLRPADHMDVLAPTLPATHSPIREDGHGNQGAYLASISAEMAQALVRLLGPVWAEFEWRAPVGGNETADADAEAAVRNRVDLSETEKQQLVMARRGQGIYRANLARLEHRCRVTGAAHPRYLRASHMKPWRVSNSAERLDGNNGLLLSPHIDHLFDQGYITFQDNGALLISPQADLATLACWNIAAGGAALPFRPEQLPFMRYHREFIFRSKH